VDGQRRSWGDTRYAFSIQSVSKPFTYAINLNDFGSEHVHKYIGQEPSGRLFNEICLDYNNKPHNPMINAGAILCASLVQPTLSSADRFDYIVNKIKSIAGGEFVGFSNSTFLSERESAFRNNALAFFMQEYKAFPPHVRSLNDVLDFYFQLCSVEVNCESLAVMAATLANGGFCPITGERVLSNESCKHTLSLMYSCGMYDYSGMFAFKVGLPAKSGVSGCLAVVVPNVCGFCIFSPPLDRMGNTVRGVRFCEELLNVFRFHNYDNQQHSDTATTVDPRRKDDTAGGEKLVHLLFACKQGNMQRVQRYVLQGVDLDAQDYDGRTALHIAASEGHTKLAEFLLQNIRHGPLSVDRFGHTAYDDSVNFGHQEVAKVIEAHLRKHNLPF
jgi:glutaminase